jgi:tyrosyl-DNA phosphodiesterase-1
LNDFVSAIDTHATTEETQTKSSKPDASLVGKMKIVWPTVEEIRTSIEGYQGGNSVPGKANNVNKDFLTPLYYRWSKPGAEYNNNADPLKTAKNVPHIKTFLQLSTSDNGDVPSIEWLCLTSHNLSKAAWGEFQNSAGSTSKVLFVRHWELGVFISPATLAKNIFGEGDCRCHIIRICPCTENTSTISIDCEEKDSNVNVITVPLPFDAINPEKYGNGDVPWSVDGPGKILPDAFGMIAR